MYPIRQFFEERGGVFTPDDLAFLAQYGLQRLVHDSVYSAQQVAAVSDTGEVSEPAVQQAVEPSNKIQAAAIDQLAGLDPKHVSGYRIGQTPVMALGEKLDDYAIEGLHAIAQSMANRVGCRVAVVNPWVGEEVIALLTGFRKNNPVIYCIGLFDGNASPQSKDMVDEYGPRTVMQIFDANIAAAQVQDKVAKLTQDPVELAQELDHQDLHLLVIPPSEYGVEFDAFIQHCRDDAVICGWGDRGIMTQKLGAIGISIKPHSFWSIQARTYRQAIEKLQLAGGPQATE